MSNRDFEKSDFRYWLLGGNIEAPATLCQIGVSLFVWGLGSQVTWVLV